MIKSEDYSIMDLMPHISLFILTSLLVYVCYYARSIQTFTINDCFFELEKCIDNVRLENYFNNSDCQYLIQNALECWSDFYNSCIKSFK